MTLRRYLQLDVFADVAGMGNPLGVVLDADGLDDADMQRLAAWTNLSETIFLLEPTHPQADYRVRIFTPRQELPFAGHPSVGAAWAVVEAARVSPDATALIQECAAGLLPVRIDTRDDVRRTTVRAPRAMRLHDDAAHVDLLAAATEGFAPGALTPARWNNGPTWWCMELADADAVRGAQPDLAAIARLTLASDAVGFAVFALTNASDHDLVVRAFCPADNIPEDPVTGSVNACIGALLLDADRLPKPEYVASQGREMGRDGRINVRVDDDGDVWIGGATQAVIRGTLEWTGHDQLHTPPGDA